MEYAITKLEYEKIRTLLYDESGISLGDSKQSLVVSHLTKRLRDLHMDSFASYCEYVTQDNSGEEFTRMLDLLSTNKTDFSREPKHFEFLRERILPTLEKQIRIWSSACSTGEEPYTIAMTLYESVRSPEQWNFQVLASDISTRVLAHATRYGSFAMEQLINEILKRGGLKHRLEVKLFGAGRICEGNIDVGARNTEWVLQFLKTEGYAIAKSDLGTCILRRCTTLPIPGAC